MKKSNVLVLLTFVFIFVFSAIANSQESTKKRVYTNDHKQCVSNTAKKVRCKNYVLKNDSVCYIHRKKLNEKK